MDREALLRRIVHLSAPLFLIYYFLPSPLWGGGPSREVALLIVLAAVLLFELFRLWRGVRVPGLRDYEGRQISAAAWAGVALALTMLFFPFSLAAPAVTGMALIDPLISVLRKTRLHPAVPLIAYFLLAIALLLLFYPLSVQVLAAALLAAPLAIGAEAIKTRYVDDDFLMIMIPLVGMSAILLL